MHNYFKKEKVKLLKKYLIIPFSQKLIIQIK